MEELEIWKPVVGYEGHYEVSNLGMVRSLKWNKIRLLKLWKNFDGYFEVGLTKSCYRKFFRVHRLVAEAFIPNPKNLPQINHLDCNRTNNKVSNLEWTDAKGNSNHPQTRINMSKAQLNNEKRSKRVYRFTLNGEFIDEWPSLAQVQRSLGFAAGNICKHIQGKFTHAYGYIWRYSS